ncbi:hypothetical protein FRB97_002551 [Tulasnella sp. 331]|nr:hypothetical protein FRB97_002551 [Tulasnella sp. 331]KAG8884485.1 hypothetical protein FRB98_002384 [Tulasnella sp. 332]
MPFPIKLSRPVNPKRVPSFETILANGRTILANADTWIEGRTFKPSGTTVQTFTKKIPTGPPWFMRVSRHPPSDGTFSDFWDYLGENHAKNEAEYVPDIAKATLILAIEPGVMEVWSIHYELTTPFSPRTFTVLIVTHLETVTPRQGWIISIPFDTTADEAMMAMEERGVRGKYAAVERIRELDDGTVEWRVATTTTVGGFVPDWITSRSVPSAIAEDVPQFITWLKAQRGVVTATKSKGSNRQTT